ncbi:MAG: hypothetical protein JZD40_02425 [Sulfolobus sp.]|nr:hypothetical protein [Sulfolobus sp.]
MSKEEPALKKAADLLRQGATMLDIACPICHMPLFKLKSGDIVCPTHGKVYLVKDEEEEKRISLSVSLDLLEETLFKSMGTVADKLKSDPMDSDALLQVIRYLDAIERIRKIKSISNSATNK